jgi:ribonuclease HII
MPLAELEAYLASLDGPGLTAAIKRVARDPRAGARKSAARFARRLEAEAAEERRTEDMHRFEWGLREQGYRVIAGVDEVGRGALAGPLTAAAVVLPEADAIQGLKDSKLLDEARRDALAVVIRQRAVACAVVHVHADEIDREGIQLANMMGMRRAVEALSLVCDYVLADGFQLTGMPMPCLGLVRGDRRSASIAAASILAKSTRDALMREMGGLHPGYGFREHVGYSTAAHVQAIRKLGPSPIHRRSFAPVATCAEPELELG